MADADADDMIEDLVDDLRSLAPSQQNEVIRRLWAAPPPTGTPTPTPTPTGKVPVTRQQLATPSFCYSDEWAALQKSGNYEIVE
jgi:hypothetical protein